MADSILGAIQEYLDELPNAAARPPDPPRLQPIQSVQGIRGVGDFINLLAQTIPPVVVPSYESQRPKTVKPSAGGIAADSIAALVNTLASFGQLQRDRSSALLNAAQVSGAPAQFLNQPQVRQQLGSTLVPGGQSPEFTPSLKEQEAIAAGKLQRGEIKIGDPESMIIPGVANQVWRSQKLKHAAEFANERAVNAEYDRLTKDLEIPQENRAPLLEAIRQEMIHRHLSQYPMDEGDIALNGSYRGQAQQEINRYLGQAKQKSQVKLQNDLTKTMVSAGSKLIGKVPGLTIEDIQAMADVHTLPLGPERDAALSRSAEAGAKMSKFAETTAKRNEQLANEKIKNFRSLIESRKDAVEIRRDNQQRQWANMFFQQEMRAKAKAISEENKLATEEFKSKMLMGFKPGEEPKPPEMKSLGDDDVQDAMGFALEQVRGMQQGKSAAPSPSQPSKPTSTTPKVYRFDSQGNLLQ